MTNQLTVSKRIDHELVRIESIERNKEKFSEPGVPALVKQIGIALCDSETISKMSDEDIDDLIIECVGIANIAGGWKEKDNLEIDILISFATKEITGRASHLTKKEVRLLFEMGASGKLGESFGLSARSALLWIDRYLTDTNRHKAKVMLLEPLKMEKPKITREDREKFANKAYSTFLKDGYYNDLGNIVYLFLSEIGVIDYSKEERKEFFNKARDLEILNLKNAVDMNEKRTNNRILESIKNMELNGANSDTDKIRAKSIVSAMKTALNEFFKALQFDENTEIPFN